MRRARTLLLVDLSYQTYRACAGYPNLMSAEREPTGGLFGFMTLLAKTINDTEADHVVICQDRRPYRRSELYPQYKMLRKDNEDKELKEKVNAALVQVLGMCKVVGLPVLGVDGFESDDIVGHFVHTQRGRFGTIYAASNDSDLYQLFWCPWFKVYRKSGMENVMDAVALKRETGLEPAQFVLAAALMGTHNDVEGIKGVGIKTACKAVRDGGMLRMYREQHRELIERNERLVRLPYEGFPRETALPSMGKFRVRDLYRYCARYDINVTGQMINAFEKVAP